MKLNHLICLGTALCVLTGCSSGTAESAAPAGEEPQASENAPAPAEPSETSETSETVPSSNGVSVHWVREPNLKLDGIHELEAESYWGIPETTYNEKHGYPQDWDDTVKPEYEHYMEPYTYDDDYYDTEIFTYTPNAIAVISDGKEGIFDYSGNQLMPVCAPSGSDYGSGIRYYPGLGFGFPVEGNPVIAGILDADFRSVIPGNFNGIGGDPGVGYYIMNGTLYRGGNDNPVEPGTAILDAYGHNCLVKILSPGDNPYMAETIGYAVFDAQGNRKKDFEGLSLMGYYVNGYCPLGTKKAQDDSAADANANNGTVALYDMNTCEPITEAVYSGAGYFESGFCPVRKGEKWGFIDENGNEVCDFIFDDVSAVYDGKAYVGIQGVYGVLDLAGTIADNIPITMETCYPNGIPEGEKPAAGEIPYKNIGVAEVKVENLNTRSIPSTDGEKLGTVFPHNYYPVFEIKNDDKYTWYRISDNAWIADQNGEWVEYTEDWK